MSADSNPASTNTHPLIVIRYAKSCSQLFIKYQATGTATSKAAATIISKSLDNRYTIPDTDAPNTFLTPISLVRWTAKKEISPERPRQLITIAMIAVILIRVPSRSSL